MRHKVTGKPSICQREVMKNFSLVPRIYQHLWSFYGQGQSHGSQELCFSISAVDYLGVLAAKIHS